MPQHQLSRREFLGVVGLTAATVAARRAHAQTPPNVLIIQPDQHRGTIMGCAGDKKAATPHLDRLAAEGMRFSRCTSASPVCSPFRATLQTGLYPHKHGVVKNNIRLDPGIRCFAEVFEEAGYATGYIGKWHLDGGLPKKEGGKGLTPMPVGGFVPEERRQGWQEWHGYEKSHEYFEVWQFNDQAQKVRVEDYDWEPTWHTDVALNFIRRKRDEGKPWLYYLAYGPPHLPEECPQALLDRFKPESFVLPPDIAVKLPPEREAELRKLLQVYYAQVAAIDHEVGRLMKALKEMGVDDNTIILYTSDHGDKLGSHLRTGGRLRGKAAPYATAFRIPLIIRWPKSIDPGQVSDALVNSVDLTPTLLELAGLPPLPGMQGTSMAPWCLDGEGPRQEAVWLGLGRWRAVWDGRYIYAQGGGYNHLYNHDEDPHEIHNLLGSPSHKDTEARLHALLVKLAERTEDPMLPELRKAAPA
jgi:arylsulfatase A-like enzyme